MKTKAILSVAVALAMVSTIFATVAFAGESNSIIGNCFTSPASDDASVEAWIPTRPNEILTELVGPNGFAGAPDMYFYDAGNRNSAWATGDVDRVYAAKTIGGYGYSISDDLGLILGSGTQFHTDMNLVQMPCPSGSYDGDSVPLTWAAPVDAARIAGYLVYRSTDNATWSLLAGSGATSVVAGFWWAIPTNVERASTWTAATSYDDTTALAGNTYYYAIRYVYTGAAGVGIPIANHATRGDTPPPAAPWTPILSGGSGPIVCAGSASYPPEASALLSTPLTHNGNTVTKYVTITATITESAQDTTPDTITGARFRVDAGAWIAMTAVDGAFDGEASEAVTGQYDFPTPLTEAAHTVEVAGQDSGDGWNVTVPYPQTSFTLNDITSPTVVYSAANPPDGASRSIGSSVTIYATYTDHTSVGAATLYWWNATQGYRAGGSVAMATISTAFGCYIQGLSGSFTVYGAPGDTITYEVEVADSAIPAPNPVSLSVQQTIIPFAAAAAPLDPYPIYGFTYQYDGTQAGGYVPLLIAGCTVTVAWLNTSTSAFTTRTAVVVGSQYSCSILNYTEGGYVFTNVTANGAYAGSLGYNYTTIETVAFPGGRQQDIVCGVPYDVQFIAPLNWSLQTGGIPFAVSFEIVDRNSVRTPGYFTINAAAGLDGPFEVWAGPLPWVAGAVWTPPPTTPYTFNGIGGGDGLFADTMTITSPVGTSWWLNATEGGITELEDYLTPWDAWYLDPLNSITGWYKDYDNITINLTGGGFDWYLSQGWNLVSCPQDGVYRAVGSVNLEFDMADALNWTNMYLFTTYGLYDWGLSMATRTGGNPSAYATFDLDTSPDSTDIDCRIGYWVYMSVAGGPYTIHFTAVNATTNGPGINTEMYDCTAGWNLMGFQHNFTVWTTVPTASMFTDSTVSATLDITGPLTKIVATQWLNGDPANKWYTDYVVTDTFPGMAPLNWVWPMFTNQPGNGYWLWVSADTTITYSTVF